MGKSGPRPRDMTGWRGGMLTVLGPASSPRRGPHWLCRCDCGNKRIIAGDSLKGGQFSCGCARNHGKSQTRTYRIWKAMRTRCYNPKAVQFKDYGGRGITVCVRWEKFQNFLADLGEAPEGFSIERVDVDAGYSPENCLWIPRAAQALNRRNSRFIVVHGERILLREAARRAGLNYKTVLMRAYSGWPKSRWFEPVQISTLGGKSRRGVPFIVVDGQRFTITEAARRAGLSSRTVLKRIRRGWPASRWLESAHDLTPPGGKKRR